MMQDNIEPASFISGYFYKNSMPLQNGPKWNMSLLSAGNMRFRWNEANPNRNRFLKKIAGEKDVAAVELIHSRLVYAIDALEDCHNREGDGLITTNKNLITTVTVADCMPVFLYDSKNGVFGTLHSGWKGTGIVGEAIKKAGAIYGSKPEDFSVVLGPHIHDCCYYVDQDRAQYFRVNFCRECVVPVPGHSDLYALSLAKANLAVLRELGVNENNIVLCKDCTCCNTKFGSFRRQTSGLPDNMPMDERSKHFTVQVAWTGF